MSLTRMPQEDATRARSASSLTDAELDALAILARLDTRTLYEVEPTPEQLALLDDEIQILNLEFDLLVAELDQLGRRSDQRAARRASDARLRILTAYVRRIDGMLVDALCGYHAATAVL